MPDIRADGIALYAYRTLAPRSYEFLQLYRSKKARGFQQTWQTVYGGVKKKETAVEAALRELHEETHLRPIRLFQVEFLETFYFRPKDYVLVMPVFAAEVSFDAKIKLNKEHTAHRWIPETQIEKSFMWRTQREALGHVLSLLRRGSSAMHLLNVELSSKKRKQS